MFFDSKNFGLADAAIALEIAQRVDDGQPKAKLIDSMKHRLASIAQRHSQAKSQANEAKRAGSSLKPA